MEENDQNGKPVKVVKVKPYPIPCLLKKDDSSTPIKCQIIKLELTGFFLKANNFYFKPGENYQCEFELPAFHNKIKEAVKVIKTYEAATGEADRAVTVEVHFKDRAHKYEDLIRQFHFKIGQKSAS